MIRFLIIIIFVILIFIILHNRSRKTNSKISPNFYKITILCILIAGILFFLATSGRFILPQILGFLKIGLPFLTKFIGL